jgi:nicotinamidase-related amidase
MLDTLLPITLGEAELSGRVGLVVVDPGVGFTRRGALSDPERMVPMVHRIGAEYRALKAAFPDLRVLVFLDTHHPDIPEPPYPTHGVIGTGEEDVDPDLAWLLAEPGVTVVRKDCINGFVGAIDRHTGRNAFAEWAKDGDFQRLVVTGDCTDICVSDFVVSALSARNHGLLTAAADRDALVAAITGLDIVVLEPACATFDAPSHPAAVAHRVGLWVMAGRGAVLASGWRRVG